MAKQDLTRIYSGADLSGATTGVIYLPVVRASTLENASVRSDAAQTGAAVFEVRKNGVIISGLSALTIAAGAKIGTVAGLSIALVDGDEITLNLVSGAVSAPVTLNLGVDDGIAAGGAAGGALDGYYNLVSPGEIADYTWLSQDTATAVKRGKAIVLRDVGAASFACRGLLRPLIAAPFTITMGFNCFAVDLNAGLGLVLQNSASGKLQTFRYIWVGGTTVYLTNWDSPTSFSANIGQNSTPELTKAKEILWLRITDNGTLRKFWVSSDGDNWREVLSTGSTDFVVPNKAGFFCGSASSADPQQIKVISFSIE